MAEVDVNLAAVIVAAVISMTISMFWYSQMLFGKLWMSLAGLTKKDLDSQKKSMAGSMFWALVAAFVMSFILAHFVDYAGAISAGMGIAVGFWLWLGLVATTQLNSVLWEKKPLRLWIINNGNYLLNLLVMGAILAAWV